MESGIQLYFSVSCLAIIVEHLVVSPLYMLYTAAMSYRYYYNDDISILACAGEVHFAASTQQDEEYYGFALEVLGTVMAEVTLGVKINRILAL